MAICIHAFPGSYQTAPGSRGYCGACQSDIVLDAEGHWCTERHLNGHAASCPGAPNMKGICAPPCPAYKPPADARLAPLYEELRSQGIVSATVDDGTVFMFSRAVIEELYSRLQANPEKQSLVLFIQRDPKKVAAARAAGRN